MPGSTIVAKGGYVLTEAGKRAAHESEHCECVVSMRGLLLVCDRCETVFALLRPDSLDWPPRTSRSSA